MAPRTVANYLGLLEEDPDNSEALEGLRLAVDGRDPSVLGENPVRLLEMARVGHERRGEIRAAAFLIELEAPLIHDDPDLEAALFKELGRLRREELLDDRGARAAYDRALELRPGDEEVQEAVEQVDQAAVSWEDIARRFVEEAEGASDAMLKTAHFARAASLIWQYQKAGRNKQVDRLFKKALKADPTDTRVARLYAETLQERERWEDLAELLADAAERARNTDDQVNLLVRCGRVTARHLEDPEGAALRYRRVLMHSPAHEEALRYLVEFFTERERWDDLVTIYEEALQSRRKLDSEAGILLQLAMVHWRIRKSPEEAEPYFSRLRKAAPGHPGVLEFFREYLKSTGDSARMVTVLSDAQRVVDDPERKLELAIELAHTAQEGDSSLERAIDAWKTVQRIDPTNEEATGALSELYRRSGKWNALVELLKSQADAVPRDESDRRVELLREVVPIYRDHLSLDAMVINTYNSILEIRPDDASSLQSLAETYESVERWNDLIQILNRLAEVSEDKSRRVELLTKVAALWIDRFTNFNQATGPLETVLEIDPENRLALERLKEIYEQKRAWGPLFEVLRKEAQLASDPEVRLQNKIDLANLAGDRLHKHKEAIDLWKEVLEQAPASNEALDALEKLAEREKDWATSAEVLERRVEAAGDEQTRVPLLQKLGTLYGEHLNEPAKAASTWERVLSLDPKNARATRTLRESFLAAGDWDGLDAMYQESGDWEGLVEVLGAAADRAEDPALKVELSFRAAFVYEERIQEPHRAFRNYERIISVDPDNVRAATALIPIYEKDEKWSRLISLKEMLCRRMDEESPTDERLAIIDELRVLCLTRLSDEDAALRWAKEAYRIDPSSLQAIRGLEEAVESTGAYEELMELYRSRLETVEGEENVRLRREIAALAGERLGRTGEAIEQLEQILQSDPQDAEAIDVLDRLYRAEQRIGDLKKLYLHRLEHHPDGRLQWLEELAALEEDLLDDSQSAAGHYQEILEVDPHNEAALSTLDRLYTSAGQSRELVPVLRMRAEHSTDPEERVALLMRLGDILAGPMDDAGDAIAQYSEVLDIEPTHGAATRGLEGIRDRNPELASEIDLLLEPAYESARDDAKLAGVLQRRIAVTVDPGDRRDLRLRLAEIRSTKLGDPSGAYDALSSALVDFPNDAELWDQLAAMAESGSRWEDLAQTFGRIVQTETVTGPDAAELSARTARIYRERLARPKAAEPFHKRVLADDPMSDDAFGALREIYTDGERWEDLEQLCREKIGHTLDAQQKIELLLQVCFLFEELLDKPDKAVEAYQEVLELDPAHAATRRSLERLYRRTEQWEELAGLLRTNLETAEGQDRLDLTFELGELAERRLGDPAAAVEQYEIVLVDNPNHLRSQEALQRLIGEPTQRQRIASILEPLYEAQGASQDLTKILEVQLEAAEDPGSRVGLLLRIAELHEQKLSNLTAAFDATARAFRADPGDFRPREELARVAKQAGSEHARAEVIEGVVEDVADAELLGELLMELALLWDQSVGDMDRAEKAYERLISSDADNPEVVLVAARALERIHMARGDHGRLATDLKLQIKFEDDQEAKTRLLARLAELLENVLDDQEGAIAALSQRLEIDPSDLDSLHSLERLYERMGRWTDLVRTLRIRDGATDDSAGQRTILQRIGEIEESRLEDADNAIAAYADALSRFGPDRVTLDALSRLYEGAARWDDLLDIVQQDYEQAGDVGQRAHLRYRAAELMRRRTGDIERSIEGYSEVLQALPDHEGALNALEEIIRGEDADARMEAARVLEPRYDGSAQYEKLIAVLLVLAEGDDASLALRALRRSAEVADVGLESPSRAFDYIARAVRVGISDPDVGAMLGDLERLAEAGNRFEDYVGLLKEVASDILDGDLQIKVYLKVAHVANVGLGNAELAREFYGRVLNDQPENRQALDALEELHQRVEDHEGLLDILGRKADLADDSEARVALLLRQAQLCETKLGDMARAIDCYEQVLGEAEREEAFDGLERLYKKGEKWEDLAALLERRIEARIGGAVDLRHRLGQIYATHLSDQYRAIELYREVLAEDPNHEPTVNAIESLMDEEEHRAVAAEILEPVFLQRMDWPKVTAVLEARVKGESDPVQRKELLGRLAQIRETYSEDLDGAFETYARMFREEPSDESVWDVLARLARNLDKHARLAEVYGEFLDDIEIDDEIAAKLAYATAQLHDEKTGDLDKASVFCGRALAFDPTRRDVFLTLESVLIRRGVNQELLALYRGQVDVVDEDAERIALLHKSARITDASLGDPVGAIEVYREILGIEPTDAEAVLALDRLYTAQELWSDLVDHLRLRIDNSEGAEDEIPLRHRLGDILAHRLDDRDGALDVFEEIVHMASTHEPTVSALEVMVQEDRDRLRITQILEPIYRASGQWKKLVAILEAQVGLNEDPLDRGRLLAEIAGLHEEKGRDLGFAFHAWARAFECEPAGEQVRREVDRVGAMLGAWDDLVAAYEKAIAVSDDTALTSSLLGTIARLHDERRGDPRSAIKTYERMLETDPDDSAPLDALDGLHTMVGDWKGLVEVLSMKVERAFDPAERAALLRRSGSVLEELLSDAHGALNAYRKATEEDENDAVAFAALDRLYTDSEDHAQLAEVLTRRMELVTEQGERVEVGLRLGAVLEEKLKQPELAIDAYLRVLEEQSAQPKAVEALGRLFERQAMWPELLENLRLRASLVESADARVKLVHRAGEVLERELDDMGLALDHYAQAAELDGRHEPTIEALMRIAKEPEYLDQAAAVLQPRFQVQERWDDLVTLLAMKAEVLTDPLEKRNELAHLAQVHEQGRNDSRAAFDALSQALLEDPGHAQTADDLSRLAVRLENWSELGDVFSARAAAALDPNDARNLFERAAGVAIEHLGDDARAIRAYMSAIEQVGDDPRLLVALDGLYEKTGAYAEMADVLERRIGLVEEPGQKHSLLVRLGAVREQRFTDGRGALSAYREVLEQDPSHGGALEATERLARGDELPLEAVDTLDAAYRELGQMEKVATLFDTRIRIAETDGERGRLLQDLAAFWEQEIGRPEEALAAMKRAVELDPAEPDLLEELERLAEVSGRWEGLRGMVERICASADVDPTLVRDLNLRAASWYRDRLGDLGATEHRLRAAIDADSEALEAHAALVQILRQTPDRQGELILALKKWGDVEVNEVSRKGYLAEAASLARSSGEVDIAATCLESILGFEPNDAEALDALFDIRAEQERWSEALSLLDRRIDAEADPQQRLILRHRHAELCSGQLNDEQKAIEAYQRVLDEEPTDLRAIDALDGLFERTEQWQELQQLIERRLDVATDPQEQIAARVRLAGLVEQRFGRRAEAIDRLREILGIDAGNSQALDEMERLLGLDEQWEALVALLTRRSEQAAEAGDVDREVSVLRRMMEVYEERLADDEKAIAVLERVLILRGDDVEALSALARLREKASQFGEAVDALGRLVELLPAVDAEPVAGRVADIALERLNDPAMAERVLRSLCDRDPSLSGVRKRLESLYEAREQWEQLAELLLLEERQTDDDDAKVGVLKRIASLYSERLDRPQDAALHLERAAALVPDDRDVLLPLCDLYIAAGRAQDAVPVLEKIIESYGTRRVKEVAQFHHQLGRALEGMGDVDGALARYDAAFKIDLTNVGILRDLARLCHEKGDLDRAQKTYRALLLQKLDAKIGISKADVYFCLGDISSKQGDKAKAISMLQRAVAENAEHAQAKELLASLKG